MSTRVKRNRMGSWLRRERTRRWFEPVGYLVAFGCLVALAVVAKLDNPIGVGLVVAVAVALASAFVGTLGRRPRISLSAEYGAYGTTARGDVRIASAVVTLFVRNKEGAGAAKHVKVEVWEVAPTRVFHLDGPGREAATEHYLDGDTHTITWQPGVLAPGGVDELQLRSDEFPFTESVSERVRLTADRTDPVEVTLVLRVNQYDDDSLELLCSVE